MTSNDVPKPRVTLDDLRAARWPRFGRTPAQIDADLQFARLVKRVPVEELVSMPTPSQERH